MPCSAYIGLGSNLGQSRRVLLEAWYSLAEHQDITLHTLSSPYCTKPVAMDSQHWFINAAGRLCTTLSPENLLDVLLETEQRFGRVRVPGYEGYQDRPLDLDLLLFDEQLVQTKRLILPHPAISERMFVLSPLAEIAPQLRHPLLNKTIAELKAALEPKMQQGDIQRACWVD